MLYALLLEFHLVAGVGPMGTASVYGPIEPAACHRVEAIFKQSPALDGSKVDAACISAEQTNIELLARHCLLHEIVKVTEQQTRYTYLCGAY